MTVPTTSRPEYEIELAPFTEKPLERRLPLATRLWQYGWLRKGVILVALAVIWELVARYQNNDLLLPGFLQTAEALFSGLASGELLQKSATSLDVLIRSYLIGIVLAFGLTTLAVSTQVGRDLLSTLTSMLNPLPAIALLPLALLWFGLGEGSLIFVLVHSVLWPLALSTYAGFLGVSETQRMAGRNYGLKGVRFVALILVPAALPAILSGLKVGWAFAWRTLIAAELVFGATSSQGGLGWYIYQNRNELYTDNVFAGLTVVIIIGLLVENLIFNGLERITIKRWGMQR
jgi:NitT/TauT family transport system permease protein